MRVLHPIRTLSARRVFRSWTLCQNGWGFQVRAKSLRTRPARPYEVGRRSRASHGLRMGTLRRSLPGAEAMRVDGRALEAKPRFGALICCQIVKPVLRRHRSAMVAFASPRPCEWTCRRVWPESDARRNGGRGRGRKGRARQEKWDVGRRRGRTGRAGGRMFGQ